MLFDECVGELKENPPNWYTLAEKSSKMTRTPSCCYAATMVTIFMNDVMHKESNLRPTPL